MKKYDKTVNDYLRDTFNTYVRNILIENCCCKCGSTENLHLHHDNISHNELCNECIEDLGYDKNKSCLDFTGRQLQNLDNIYIGKSFTDVKYKTLCNECHRKLHGENGYKQKSYGDDGKKMIDIINEFKEYDTDVILLKKENENLTKENENLTKEIHSLRTGNKQLRTNNRDLKQMLNNIENHLK